MRESQEWLNSPQRLATARSGAGSAAQYHLPQPLPDVRCPSWGAVSDADRQAHGPARDATLMTERRSGDRAEQSGPTPSWRVGPGTPKEDDLR